jgi:hypothetical protein
MHDLQTCAVEYVVVVEIAPVEGSGARAPLGLAIGISVA